MKKTLSIAIACAIGAGIGTLIGMYWFTPLSFWGYVIAIISGGAIAYFVYDIEEICNGIKHSYAATKEARANKKPRPDLSAYVKYKRLVRLSCYYGFVEVSGYINLISAAMAVVSILMMVLINHFAPPAEKIGVNDSVTLWFVYIYGGLALLVNIIALFQLCVDDPAGIEHYERKRLRMLRDRKSLRWLKKYCKESNDEIARKKDSIGLKRAPRALAAFIVYNPPLLIAYSSVYLLCKGLWWSIVNITTILTALKKVALAILMFLSFLFKYIHSDRRLLCFFDGAIGTCIGLYFNSPIIGLLAGAVVGIANYELISVRLLKLQLRH